MTKQSATRNQRCQFNVQVEASDVPTLNFALLANRNNNFTSDNPPLLRRDDLQRDIHRMQYNVDCTKADSQNRNEVLSLNINPKRQQLQPIVNPAHRGEIYLSSKLNFPSSSNTNKQILKSLTTPSHILLTSKNIGDMKIMELPDHKKRPHSLQPISQNYSKYY